MLTLRNMNVPVRAVCGLLQRNMHVPVRAVCGLLKPSRVVRGSCACVCAHGRSRTFTTGRILHDKFFKGRLNVRKLIQVHVICIARNHHYSLKGLSRKHIDDTTLTQARQQEQEKLP